MPEHHVSPFSTNLWLIRVRTLWKASENWPWDRIGYGAWALITVVSYLTWFQPSDLGQWLALGLLGPALAISAVTLGVLIFLLVGIPYRVLRSVAVFLWWALRVLNKVRKGEGKDIVSQLREMAERD